MFKKPTVILTGAGASWHYGLPTGPMLIRQMVTQAAVLERFFSDHVGVWGLVENWIPDLVRDRQSVHGQNAFVSLRDECREFSHRVSRANPLVIDYFLGHNRDLETIGKLLIAICIMRAQANLDIARTNPNRAAPGLAGSVAEVDDWLAFVIHEITSGCIYPDDLLSNDVRFVTFNYDTLIEERLYDALKELRFFNHGLIATFLKERVIHIYGKTDFPSRDPDMKRHISRFRISKEDGAHSKSILNFAYAASKSLRILEPASKQTDAAEIIDAIAAIESSKRLIVLGYGFDKNNNARLELDRVLKDVPRLKYDVLHSRMRVSSDMVEPSDLAPPKRDVYFTNFEDHDRVNARLGRLFLDDANAFTEKRIVRTFQKSIRNVYEALAKDFESYD